VIKRLAIIGGGNMGLAYARAFLDKGIVGTAQELTIIEAHEERRSFLTREFGFQVTEDFTKLEGSGVIFLAVKPQDLALCCADARQHVAPDAILVSIMAGVTMARIAREFRDHRKIVRAMPNMPAQIGMGITAYVNSEGIEESENQLVQELLSSTGESLRLASEDLIDASTAMSGSGPAYFFYFIEHMLQAGEELGLSAGEAELLTYHTIRGAVELWKSGSRSPEELRRMVTSKGGTTEAALHVLLNAKTGDQLRQAIHSACARAKELGST
jgi:pyrroline-5-carboxylate reductase